jgi:integrase
MRFSSRYRIRLQWIRLARGGKGINVSIYRRGRIWYADFYNGKSRVQVSTGTANRREAEKFLALRVSEVERGEFVRPARITLAELGAHYMDYDKANKRSWLRDQQILTHLNSAFGTTLLPDITALPIERYKLLRLEAVSPATVNRELAGLKRLFNVAEQWGLFRGRNPVKDVRFLDENNLKVRTLSDEEEAALLSRCSPYLQDLVAFAINTGLRLGEILNLTWKEVDLENAVLKLLVRKNRRMLEVPLNDTALSVVNGWHGIRKSDVVFYNPETGGHWKDLWLGLKKACRQADPERRDMAHLPSHLRVEAQRQRRGSGNGEGATWACRHQNHDALCAHKPRGEAERGAASR